MDDPSGGTHGFGFGVTGAELCRLIVFHGVCPGCAGTRRRWCVDTRSSVICSVCREGTRVGQLAGDVSAMAVLEVDATLVSVTTTERQAAD